MMMRRQRARVPVEHVQFNQLVHDIEHTLPSKKIARTLFSRMHRAFMETIKRLHEEGLLVYREGKQK